MEALNRHDIAEADAFGQLIALEACLMALVASAPDPDALRSAWRTAEDTAFMQSAEPNGVDARRHAIIKEACITTLARIRSAIERRASR